MIIRTVAKKSKEKMAMIKFMKLLCVLCGFLTCFAQSLDLENEKYLLIRFDDIGMCHSLNLAIQQVVDTGIPFSTSVMFACPWYQEAVDILRDQPNVSVGIHLTLNAEWKNLRWGPVLGSQAVPSLVDSVGFFFPSRATFFANKPLTKEIERELRAQIERALASGLRIDYIDHHMGTAVQTIELRELVEKLAKEYQLGISGYFGEVYSNVTYFPAIGSKQDSLYAEIARKEPGLNLQVLHVGLDTPELQALKDLNPFGLPQMSKHRQDELNSLSTPKFMAALQRYNVKPITYYDVLQEIGLENMKRPEIEEYK
jgi:predicted glycoside hydrolase/deacetylase ChbG (UPF0249 family)